MGASWTQIEVKQAIALARRGVLDSWAHGTPRLINARKVASAELSDNGQVTLHYGKDSWQTFEIGKCKVPRRS